MLTRFAPLLLLAACATGAPPAVRSILVENERPWPVRVRAVDASLAWCEIPAYAARPCAVTLATQPADVRLVLRPLDGARPDTVPVLLVPAARVRLPWHGAPYQPQPR